MKILIIEDEIELLIGICNYLTKEGYVCELADNFSKASEKAAIYEYDIILLDITLPDGNGLDLLPVIRKHNVKAGVIILSAKNSLDDRISGLDMGADDYLTKPFHLSELNSRIRSLLRRRNFSGSDIITFKEISINTESKIVSINDQQLKLTRKEYDMLLFLIINQNRVMTKEAIAEHLWEDNIELASTYDFIYTHLNNIRKKIKAAGGIDYVTTLYGMGYKFTDR